ncbi:putative histidine kinase response regulator and transcription factor RR-A-type family [Dioscorea sansibarensis]
MVSYSGQNRLFFSYYQQGNRTYAIFSSETQPFDFCNDTFWFYIQAVNTDTSVRYGKRIAYCPIGSNILKWIRNSLDGRNAYLIRGLGFENFQEALFLFSAPMHKVGIVSIGIEVKDFVKPVANVDLSRMCQLLDLDDVYSSIYFKPSSTIFAFRNDSTFARDNSDVKQKAVNISCYWDDYLCFHLVGLESDSYYDPHEDFEIHLVSVTTTLSFKESGCVFKKMDIIMISLFSILLFVMFIGSLIMGRIFKKMKMKEMQLCSALIKQKEATQQVERKSMNKSMAFASASHDVRTSLISITCLIELCRAMVPPRSDLDDNLLQMTVCTSKLLDILNSILDTSKVEAGKMILEEREFNVVHVIQESLDSFNVVAMSKGLEIFWDPTDFSIFKYSLVKGDRRRFSQILDNLLGNALKFTSRGHISFLAFAKKPTYEIGKIASKRRLSFSHLFCKNKDCHHDSNTSNSIENDPSYTEFIFEVSDTGIGIPKEKKAFVFENYAQVKDSCLEGHEGTGLGLGIVQSYVRLMGGEIGIKDKDPGEKGTCFRFNIFLKSCEIPRGEDSTVNSGQKLNLFHLACLWDHIGLQSSVPTMTFIENIKMGDVNIFLLIQDDETKKVAKRWLEGFGVKVREVSNPYFLKLALQQIKHKLLNLGGLGTFDLGLSSISSSKSISPDSDGELDISTDNKTLPMMARDLLETSFIKTSIPYIMVLIDSNFDNHSEICLMLKEFSQNIPNIQFKVVWLANSNAYTAELSNAKERQCDLILKKPLYGTHLWPLLSLFNKATENQQLELRTLNKMQKVEDFDKSSLHLKGQKIHKYEPEKHSLKDISKGINHLNGMSILLVEDSPVISRYEFLLLSKLGAKVEICENGLEALDKVKIALRETTNAIGPSHARKNLDHSPYDIILMDCEVIYF